MNNAGNMTGSAGQTYIDNGFMLPELYVRGSFIDNGVFSVDGPTGNINAGLTTLSTTTTGASLDTTGVVQVSAVISGTNGGAGAVVGATVVDSLGGIWQVATISGTGGSAKAATLTLIRAAYATTAPSNPVSAQMMNSNTTLQLTVTWSSNRNQLTLQPSGGNTLITGNATISGTTTLSAVTSTGNLVLSPAATSNVLT